MLYLRDYILFASHEFREDVLVLDLVGDFAMLCLAH